MEHLRLSDRSSLLSEIQALRAQLRMTHLQSQEKLQKLCAALTSAEARGSQQEHQLRRQGECRPRAVPRGAPLWGRGAQVSLTPAGCPALDAVAPAASQPVRVPGHRGHQPWQFSVHRAAGEVTGAGARGAEALPRVPAGSGGPASV